MMPLLNETDLVNMHRSSYLCWSCDESIRLKCCRSCDEFFHVGHKASCLCRAGAEDEHAGHRVDE
jgi:hypothetical protein